MRQQRWTLRAIDESPFEACHRAQKGCRFDSMEAREDEGNQGPATRELIVGDSRPCNQQIHNNHDHAKHGQDSEAASAKSELQACPRYVAPHGKF